MDIQSYLKTTTEIDTKRDYWFIRTEHGEFYDTFKENKFIALGWNEITVEEIKKSLESSDSLRVRIASISASHEKERAKINKEEVDKNNIIDLRTPKGKSKSSMIINKLQNFYNLKKGDVVVIPSAGSACFSFGIIEDNGIYVDLDNTKDCTFRKRRKVRWVTHKDFDELDTIFFMLKKSMHAISSVKGELADHIDRVMNDLYYKDGYGHYVIRVKRKEDINAQDLFELGVDMISLLNIINETYDFKETINDTIVKINVQSDGDFLLKGKIGNSIICLGIIVGLAACNSDNYKPSNPKETEIMNRIKTKIDSLEIAVNTKK